MYKSRYLERIKARDAYKPPQKVDVPILADPAVVDSAIVSAVVAWPACDSTASYYMPRRARG
jgi:hypothetical protein